MGVMKSPYPEMTPEQREAQRRSFAYGNANLSNPNITREMIDKVADRMNRESQYNTSLKLLRGTNPPIWMRVALVWSWYRHPTNALTFLDALKLIVSA